MTNLWDNPRAFAPMMEEALWTEDRPPHRRGGIPVAVFQGESQSASAGPTLSGVVADPWSVRIPISAALAANIKPGDTLLLGVRHGGAVLVVQQITRIPGWYVVRATAEERAPMP